MAHNFKKHPSVEHYESSNDRSSGSRSILTRIDNMLSYIQTESQSDQMSEYTDNTDKLSHICTSHSPARSLKMQRSYDNIYELQYPVSIYAKNMPAESPRFPSKLSSPPRNSAHISKEPHQLLYHSLNKFISHTFDSLAGLKPEAEQVLTSQMQGMKSEIEYHFSNNNRFDFMSGFGIEKGLSLENYNNREEGSPMVDVLKIGAYTNSHDRDKFGGSSSDSKTNEEIINCFQQIVDNLGKLMKILPNEEQRTIVRDIQDKLIPNYSTRKGDANNSTGEKGLVRQANYYRGQSTNKRKIQNHHTEGDYRNDHTYKDQACFRKESPTKETGYSKISRSDSTNIFGWKKNESQKSAEFFTFHENEIKGNGNRQFKEENKYFVPSGRMNVLSLMEESQESISRMNGRNDNARNDIGDMNRKMIQSLQTNEFSPLFSQKFDQSTRGWEEFDLKPSKTSNTQQSSQQNYHLHSQNSFSDINYNNKENASHSINNKQIASNSLHLPHQSSSIYGMNPSKASWC